MKTITVTRALAELKLLNDRINSKIAASVLIGAVQGEKQVPITGGYQNRKDLEDRIKSDTQGIEDLIDYRQKLKSAVILSNAQTKVQISGQTMTVAEAIELKSSIAFKQAYLYRFQQQLAQVINTRDQSNAKLEDQIQALLNTALGADKAKASEDQLQAIRGPQEKLKKVEILNLAETQAKVNKLQEEIENFVAEIDFILSESNARTEVTIN